MKSGASYFFRKRYTFKHQPQKKLDFLNLTKNKEETNTMNKYTKLENLTKNKEETNI